MEPHVADSEFERTWLDETTWVDRAKEFVVGADEVYAHLTETVPWQASLLWRYEKWVEEPRVGHGYSRVASYPHPVFVDAQRKIQHHYNISFGGFALAYYRDGNDSQAFHRDRDMKFCEDTIIAIVTFGARRPWLLRQRTRADKWTADHGGAEYDLAPAGGELIVLGGRAQADWEHSVPKLAGAGPRAGRISAQFRWTSGRGRPEVGGSYRAPRNFSRR